VFNEGTMTIRMEDPAIRDTCRESPCDTAFVASEHGVDIPGPNTDLWHPYLVGKTAAGDRARLAFSVARRWDVRWQAGETLNVRRVIGRTACAGASRDQEASTQSATEIRDPQGRLLLLNVPDLPLAGGGEALLAPGFGSEIKLSWTDLQCPAYQGPGVGSAGGGRRTVAIVVADAKGSGTSVVTWGRSAPLRLGGEPYVVSVNQGWVAANGLGCGRGALTIYRAGYLKEI
jgi:hypothetical protein